MTKVGVLVSKGYGAGWSSWGEPEMALDKELVKAFEDELSEEAIEAIAEKNWPKCYKGGLFDCEVEYVDKGIRFRIDEYDGSESLVILDYEDFLIAE